MEYGKWCVIDSPKAESGDEFVTECATEEEAKKEAYLQWCRLTKEEKKERIIFSGFREINEDESIDIGDIGFDSEKYEEEQANVKEWFSKVEDLVEKEMTLAELNEFVDSFGFHTDIYKNYNFIQILEEGSIAWNYWGEDYFYRSNLPLIEFNVCFDVVSISEHYDDKDTDLLDSIIKITEVYEI